MCGPVPLQLRGVGEGSFSRALAPAGLGRTNEQPDKKGLKLSIW